MSTGQLLLSAVALFAGGVSVGAVGFGSVLIAAPVLALFAPATIPFVFVVPTLVTDSYVAWRERAALDRALLGRFLVWQIPGALLGAWLLGRISDPGVVGLIVGLIVLLLVGFQMLPWRLHRTAGREVGAATLAGLSGAVSGINGPPVAVLLADEPPALIRATLPAFFAGAQLVLLGSWILTGTLDTHALLLGVVATPAMALGAIVGQTMAGRITARTVRWIVLVLSLAATIRSIVALA
jgi:uncharacterized membrane protein YfcA